MDIKKSLEEKKILKYGNLFDEKQYLVEKINLSLIGYYENINDKKKILHLLLFEVDVYLK